MDTLMGLLCLLGLLGLLARMAIDGTAAPKGCTPAPQCGDGRVGCGGACGGVEGAVADTGMWPTMVSWLPTAIDLRSHAVLLTLTAVSCCELGPRRATTHPPCPTPHKNRCTLGGRSPIISVSILACTASALARMGADPFRAAGRWAAPWHARLGRRAGAATRPRPNVAAAARCNSPRPRSVVGEFRRLHDVQD